MIDKINNEIRYSRSSVQDLFSSLCIGKSFDRLKFLFLCKEKMNTLPFPSAFRNSVEESRGSLSLNAEDIAFINAFFEGLGTTDTEGQLKNCQNYKIIFDERAAQALSEQRQKGRMYCTVFFLFGVAALIIAL